MINFSSVASDIPSIFMASRLTNRAKDFTCFAWQSGLVQYRVFVSFSVEMRVAPPHTGQTAGIPHFPLRVRFSAIWGMIILAL